MCFSRGSSLTPFGRSQKIDSASVYKNEAGCGAAIRKISSTVPRDQIFFTSKVPGRSLSYENAKAQVDETLKLTGLDYVDLVSSSWILRCLS